MGKYVVLDVGGESVRLAENYVESSMGRCIHLIAFNAAEFIASDCKVAADLKPVPTIILKIEAPQEIKL
jgi:hypothetical protein